jgi:hypothetical protein
LEQLTLFAEDSPAKTLALPEKVQDLKAQDQDFGLSSIASSKKSSRRGSSQKTSQPFAVEDWIKFSGASLRSGTMWNGTVYPLQPLVQSTRGIASGLLPTPVSSDATSGAVIGKNDTFYVTRSGMPRKVNQNGKDGSVGLARLVKLTAPDFWPTPTSSEHKFRLKGNTQASKCLEAQARRGELQSGASGALNPTWVEWLMGFPAEWTDLSNLETPSSPKSPN